MQKDINRNKKEELKKSYSNVIQLDKKEILGVGITDASQENILEFMVQSIQKNTKPYYIVTPNPEMLVLASKNSDFKHVLNNAKIASNDGVGIGLAAQILRIQLSSRVTGVDLVESLCKMVANWPITVGFLGAGPGVAEHASECLHLRYPKLKIVFIGEEWEKGKVALGEKYLVSSISYIAKDKSTKIQNTKYKILDTNVIDILFVAFGFPKQEFWMADKVGKIPVKVMIGVGGAFDYISGKIPRAPKFLRTIGLEWLFRLFIQPWRWKRQLALLEFVWLVAKSAIFRR